MKFSICSIVLLSFYFSCTHETNSPELKPCDNSLTRKNDASETITKKKTSAKLNADGFTSVESFVLGDLNKDKISDSVVISQDTLNDKWPYKIEIYFGNSQGTYDLKVSNKEFIPPLFPEGMDGWRTGNAVDNVEIKSGVLWLNYSLLRGRTTHKFRYQNSKFDLIGYTSGQSDGLGKMYSTDFNLMTGDYYYKEESYSDDEIFEEKKEKKIIRPLPALEEMDEEDFFGY